MSKKIKTTPDTPRGSTKSQAMTNSGPVDEDGALECSKYIYEQINKWIDNADNKVGVSCGIFTIIIGVVTFLAKQFIEEPDNAVINECWRSIYMGSLVVSLLIMAIAIIFHAWAIVPNLKSSGENKRKKKYPIYYGDISSLEFEKYKSLMKNGKKQDFNEELILENWFNSGICTRKMKRYKTGVILFIIAIALVFLSVISHILMYM